MAYKTRLFTKYEDLGQPTHISHLYETGALREVMFRGDRVEYLIDTESLVKRNTIIYEYTYNNGLLYVELYRLGRNGEIYHLGRIGQAHEASTGYTNIDKLVDEISMYRSKWSTLICMSDENFIHFYNSFLKADAALDYYLFKRIKGVWQELSLEYVGFVYALIHEILTESGCKILENDHLEGVCTSISEANKASWRGINIEYNCSGICLRVKLESRAGSVSPDIELDFHGGIKILIECKQGPPKTWINKAIKQALKYSGSGLKSALVTFRHLSDEQFSELSKHYSYVVDQCSFCNQGKCKKVLGHIIDGVLKEISS
ncbi:MAG: hypothetical protein QXW94_03090 [Desulfurococcaceae archaeon]